MPTRILLTGGGTGGHVTPALAAAGALSERYPDAEIRYAGLRSKAEGVMAPRAGYPLSSVSSRGFPALGPGLIPFAWDLGRGVFKAMGILLRHRPHLIVATGGYASAPVVLANGLLRALGLSRARLLVHEQNSHLGRMNKLAASLADLVAVSFPETLSQLPAGRGMYVGYPVRKSCAPGDRQAARQQLDLPEQARVVFAFGGSQGARTINRAVVDAARALLDDPEVWILHGCGRPFGSRSYDGVDDVTRRLARQDPDLSQHPRYRRFDFIDDMSAFYAASDLVICRAGAGSLMEVCAQEKPAVVIPKANLPGDHQVRNARVIERAGGCRVIYERIDPGEGRHAIPYVDGGDLARLVSGLLDDPAQLEAMARAAAGLVTTDARRLLADCGAFLLGDGPRPEAAVPGTTEADRVLGLDSGAMERLLQRVRAGSEPPLEPAERDLLLSKIDGLLTSGAWVQRARGCRITGLAGYETARGMLVDLARNDVPMVRRDAFIGLRHLGVPRAAMPATADELAAILAHGLADNYYETRAAAAEAVRELGGGMPQTARNELAKALADLMTDASFEVRMAACEALGHVADRPEPLTTALARLHFDPVWKVRGALFETYARLAERGVLAPDQARDALDSILITANGYLTEYQIRHCRNEAVRRVPATED